MMNEAQAEAEAKADDTVAVADAAVMTTSAEMLYSR